MSGNKTEAGGPLWQQLPGALRKPGQNRTEDDVNAILKYLSEFEDVIGFFKPLDANVRRLLALKMRIEKYSKHQAICIQGAVGDTFFIVVQGSAIITQHKTERKKNQGLFVGFDSSQLRQKQKESTEVLLRKLQPGDSFGEIALELPDTDKDLAGLSGRRSASVYAQSETHVLAIDRDAYHLAHQQASVYSSYRFFYSQLHRLSLSPSAMVELSARCVAEEHTESWVAAQPHKVPSFVYFVVSGTVRVEHLPSSYDADRGRRLENLRATKNLAEQVLQAASVESSGNHKSSIEITAGLQRNYEIRSGVKGNTMFYRRPLKGVIDLCEADTFRGMLNENEAAEFRVFLEKPGVALRLTVTSETGTCDIQVTQYRVCGASSSYQASGSSLSISTITNFQEQAVHVANARKQGYYYVTVTNLSTQSIFVVNVDPIWSSPASLLHNASASHRIGVGLGELGAGACIAGLEAFTLTPVALRYVASSSVRVLRVAVGDFVECTEGASRRLCASLQRQSQRFFRALQDHYHVVEQRKHKIGASEDESGAGALVERKEIKTATEQQGRIADSFSFAARASGAAHALLENRVRSDADRVALPMSSSASGIQQRIHLSRSQPHLGVALVVAARYMAAREDHLAYYHRHLNADGKMQLYTRLFAALPQIYKLMCGGSPRLLAVKPVLVSVKAKALLEPPELQASVELQERNSDVFHLTEVDGKENYLRTEESLTVKKKPQRPQTAGPRRSDDGPATASHRRRLRPASAKVSQDDEVQTIEKIEAGVLPEASLGVHTSQQRATRNPETWEEQLKKSLAFLAREPQLGSDGVCDERVVDVVMDSLCSKKQNDASVAAENMHDLQLALESNEWELGQFGFAPGDGTNSWESNKNHEAGRLSQVEPVQLHQSFSRRPQSARAKRSAQRAPTAKAAMSARRPVVSRASRLTQRARKGSNGGHALKRMEYNAMTEVQKLLLHHKEQDRSSVADMAIKISPRAELKLKQEHDVVMRHLSSQRLGQSVDEKIKRSGESLAQAKRTISNSKPDRAVVQSMMLKRKRNVQVLGKYRTLASQHTRMVCKYLRHTHRTVGMIPAWTPMPTVEMLEQFYAEQYGTPNIQ